MQDRSITRRRLLLGTAALPLAACGTDEATPSPATQPTAPPSTAAAPRSAPPTAPVSHAALTRLERDHDARLGVYALDTATGAEITHRADERFAFCSTFKALAAAGVLARDTPLGKVVRYTRDDLMAHAPITSRHVAEGMTIRQLCDAAVRHSDGTAGNLLLAELGGPARLTAYARGLGDSVTRMDRTEPAITTAVPGDPRDTTAPRAIAGAYREVVLGDALPADRRAFLRDLLERNTTGDARIRAGLPRGWTVADKTGTGGYGTANDIAIAWPPGRAPLVIAVMSSRAERGARPREALLAGAARYVAKTLA